MPSDPTVTAIHANQVVHFNYSFDEEMQLLQADDERAGHTHYGIYKLVNE